MRRTIPVRYYQDITFVAVVALCKDAINVADQCLCTALCNAITRECEQQNCQHPRFHVSFYVYDLCLRDTNGTGLA